MTQTPKSFEKPPISIEEQIALLKSRDLIINDEIKCHRALTFIGYYRLSGYMMPFYEQPREKHIFRKRTMFEDILKVYEFDRQLRLVCLNAIEKIEIGFRAVVSDQMCSMDKNSHWYENPQYFKDKQFHSAFMAGLKEKVGKPSSILLTNRAHKYKFIDHYHKTYNSPELPPSWMVFETLNFGDVSFAFKDLHDKYKKQIANHFGLDDKILSSWIHSICFLRNLCAHHSRVWNREMSISPKLAKRYKSIQTAGRNNYFYGLVFIIMILLDKIDSETNWFKSLGNLFKDFPDVKIHQMGFPVNWQDIFKLINASN